MGIQNYNYATTQDYRLVIPGLDEVNYFLQRTPLPGIHQNAVPTPYINNEVYVPGETITYDPLVLEFIVDENHKNHRLLQYWMYSHHYEKDPIERTKDITLHIQDRNSKAIIEYTFYNAFPTDIEQISLDATLGESEPMLCSATFRYEYYRMTKGMDL